MNIIHGRKISMVYDGETVVREVNLSVKKGEIFGLLGTNGAGKTTVFYILSTMLFPTGGSIIIKNHNIKASGDEIRKIINVVFQEFMLDEELTALQNLDFYAQLYKVKESERRNRVYDILTFMGLEQQKNKLVGKFSGGMKKRLDIARALINNPEIIFFDEPMSGLDPIMQKKLQNYLLKINKEKGVTIVIATHDLNEAEKLCDTIAVLDRGRIVWSGSTKQMEKPLEDIFTELTK